jgi:predicted aldo/keto reductase-like oxidoreductase
MPSSDLLPSFPRETTLRGVGTVMRLGLATRGDTQLDREAVLWAIDRGVNYLNWCGQPDGLQEAVQRLGGRRRDVHIAVQLEARDGAGAARELATFLRDLGTDYLDVVTYYYVEHSDEWDEIIAPGGAAELLEEARQNGTIRAIGMTSHQRPLAARIAATGRLDVLMIRYNAAHRGAEQEVFPVSAERGIPVVAFTGTRWGALMRNTREDPAGFVPPPAREWYRFVLSHPNVAVALMAPASERELQENLLLLDDWRPPTPAERAVLLSHGMRVRQCAGAFP